VIFVVGLGGAVPALAEDAQPLEELFVGQVVFTQEPLELQTTLRGAWSRTPAAEALSLGPLFELGLTDRLQLELEVEVPVAMAFTSAGATAGDPEARAGFKYASADPVARGAGLAAGLEIGFPIPATAAGRGELAAEVFTVIYRKLGPLHLNLTTAVELSQPGGPPAPWVLGFEAAVSFFLQLGPFLPVLELGWSHGDEASYVVAPAIVWHAPLDLEIGLSAPLGIHEGSTSYGAILLLTYEIELGGG
jgi:hypothetical protein